METTTNRKETSAKTHKCEHLAVSPRGDKHCVHDDHINWKMKGGCKRSLCPIALKLIWRE